MAKGNKTIGLIDFSSPMWVYIKFRSGTLYGKFKARYREDHTYLVQIGAHRKDGRVMVHSSFDLLIDEQIRLGLVEAISLCPTQKIHASNHFAPADGPKW